MGLLDRIKGFVPSPPIPSVSLGRRGADGDDEAARKEALRNAIGDDADEEITDDDIAPHRSDILEVLGIPETHDVPNDVLLPGDMDSIRFDITSPSGYSVRMVDEFFDSVSKSIQFYVDQMKDRNREIALLATQVDKAATDLHNAKINAELSDGLTVLTGQQSSTDQQLQEAQLLIVKLRDENNKLRKSSKGASGGLAGDDRFDELQNQLGLMQMENGRLKAENDRLRRGRAAQAEAEFVPPTPPVRQEPGEGLPDPFAVQAPTVGATAESETGRRQTLADAAQAEDEISGFIGNDPTPIAHRRLPAVPPSATASHATPNDAGGLPDLPGMDDRVDDSPIVPLPDANDDDYDDVSFDDDGNIDMSHLV